MAIVRFTRRSPRMALPGFPGAPIFDDVESRVRKFFEGNALMPFDVDQLPAMVGWAPAMEIAETANELTLTAELPGLDNKDVDISVDDRVLTISGEKTTEHKEGDDKKFHLLERTYGSFQRSFTLPQTVDAAKVSAEFTKGVLTVKMPKTIEAKEKGRKIEIAAK